MIKVETNQNVMKARLILILKWYIKKSVIVLWIKKQYKKEKTKNFICKKAF